MMRAILLMLVAVAPAEPTKSAWTDLVGEVWKGSTKGWINAGEVAVDAKNPRRLVSKPGHGILVNGKTGREHDLLTKTAYGDLELEMEFFIPKGSNSGVKFHGVYEIQICDSFGKKELTGSDCGGIYPRAEMLPIYHHIDKGIAPKTNACKAPGQWQKLSAIFLAPRFDKDGKKNANARMVKVTLNGQTIHDNVELKTPTGHNWSKKEAATGPLLLQGDHGPVAFRHVRVRPYVSKKE